MLNEAQKRALVEAFHAAKESGHLFPDYAACEVMEETKWGTSASYREGNNCFGKKQQHPPVYETVLLPTRECIAGKWISITAPFIKYPSKAASFADRMETLRRLAPKYPHYAAALQATDGVTFMREVCKSWSTDPHKADTVIAIHDAHKELLSDVACVPCH